MKIFELLDGSSATDEFRDAVNRFVRDGRPNERLTFNRDCPPVKVERTAGPMRRTASSPASMSTPAAA